MAKKSIVSMKADFPLYCLSMVGDRHLLVAGGGGSTKSGITNAIDVYELKYDNKMLMLHRVNHYETNTRAVMNCAVVKKDKHFSLAVGVDNSCMLYSLRYKLMVPKIENEVLEGVRKRKNNFTNSTNHNMATKMIGFEVEPGEEVVSNKDKDGYQKVVRIHQDTNSFFTAGTEGVIRCWELNNVSMKYEVNAHSNDIDDLDVSPDGKYLVSVSKGDSTVWDAKEGTKVSMLECTKDFNKSHRLRNCRFCKMKDSDKDYFLYTTYIPRIRGSKSRSSNQSGILRWDCNKFTSYKNVSLGTGCISAFSVSDEGTHVAVGTMEGSISVYTSPKLQRIYNASEVHSIFVTGLEFSPSTPLAIAVTGHKNFTLFSISADNFIKVHQKEPEAAYSAFWIFIGSAILIFLLFWVSSSTQLFGSS